MKPSIYTRLTRRKRRFFGYSQLWLAPDHLLLVTNSRYTERYQRFLLAEIEAIVVTDLPDRAPLQISLAVLALLWTAFVFGVSSSFAKGFFLITGLLFLSMVMVDFLRGPRCRCLVQTAVGQTLLIPIARQRQASRFLAVVTPAIESAQNGTFDERTVVPPPPPLSFGQNVGEAPMTLFGAIVNAPTAPPALPTQNQDSSWLLFGLLLLTGLIVWAALTHAQEALVLLITAYGAEFTVAVLVIIQGRANPWRVTYILAVLASVLVLADITLTGVAGWTLFASLTRAAGAAPDVTNSWISPSQTLLYAVGGRIAMGLAGLAAWYFESGASRKLVSS